jgi:hypothetical protein
MKKYHLKTSFWRNAANSLPAAVRARYMTHLESAERWELALDAAIEGFKACLTVRAVPKPPPPLAR